MKKARVTARYFFANFAHDGEYPLAEAIVAEARKLRRGRLLDSGLCPNGAPPIIARYHYSQLAAHEGPLSRCEINPKWVIMGYF